MNLKRNMKTGDKVIYIKSMLALDENTVGILTSIHGTKGCVEYPQHKAYEDEPDKKGNWILKKGVPNKISALGCDLSDLKLVE